VLELLSKRACTHSLNQPSSQQVPTALDDATTSASKERTTSGFLAVRTDQGGVPGGAVAARDDVCRGEAFAHSRAGAVRLNTLHSFPWSFWSFSRVCISGRGCRGVRCCGGGWWRWSLAVGDSSAVNFR
jgi:hypothetical protein